MMFENEHIGDDDNGKKKQHRLFRKFGIASSFMALLAFCVISVILGLNMKTKNLISVSEIPTVSDVPDLTKQSKANADYDYDYNSYYYYANSRKNMKKMKGTDYDYDYDYSPRKGQPGVMGVPSGPNAMGVPSGMWAPMPGGPAAQGIWGPMAPMPGGPAAQGIWGPMAPMAGGPIYASQGIYNAQSQAMNPQNWQKRYQGQPGATNIAPSELNSGVKQDDGQNFGTDRKDSASNKSQAANPQKQQQQYQEQPAAADIGPVELNSEVKRDDGVNNDADRKDNGFNKTNIISDPKIAINDSVISNNDEGGLNNTKPILAHNDGGGGNDDEDDDDDDDDDDDFHDHDLDH